MARPGRHLEFHLLGPLEVLDGGSPLSLGGPKQRALLASLLIHSGEVVSVDRIMEDLWGDHPPKTAQTALHVYVSHLRKLLEPERGKGEAAALLASRAPGYVIDVDPEQVDLTRFQRLASQGRLALDAGDPRVGGGALHEALALWRGPALADFLYEPFAQSEIARLEELRLSCTEDRIDADLACGLHGPLVGEIEGLTRAHPLRERLRGQLILALYRSGRQAEALEAYTNARETLVEELGIDPGPALQELNRAILNQDPALDAKPLPQAIVAPAEASFSAPPTAAPAVLEPVEAEEPEPAAEPLPPQEMRKVVTFLRAGLVERASLAERLDPEVLRRVLRRYGDAAASAIERHGGRIEATGDGSVLGVFGIPRAHEDDALRAVRAAVDLRELVAVVGTEFAAVLGQELVSRVALDTGEVISGNATAGQTAITGDASSTATELEQAAGPGEILLTDATRRLVPAGVHVEPIDPVPVGGRTDPIRAWRLVELVQGAPAFDRLLETPLVGREHELEQLHGALARAVRERTLVLFTLLGTAGVGKSRLTREHIGVVGSEATVLVGRCQPYGEGITFWPLREIVQQAVSGDRAGGLAEVLGEADDRDAVAERIGGLVGLDEAEGPSPEAFSAVRRLIETLAQERPLVLVVEDIHWAEPTFLDLLDYLADWVRDAPVLLLCLARPDLLDARPTWGGGKHNTVSLLLEPLAETAAESLIETLPGGESLDATTRARLTQAAEGNPLFIEQMLALIAQDGPPEGDLVVPPTIQAILAARLDRLGPAERAVIERGALVGREFWVSGVRELSPVALRPTVELHLMSLVRKELIRGTTSSLPGHDAFRFRHALIRDAAYRAMAKELRAELHEQFADWLEQSEESGAYAEIVGHHLEQGYRYRAELGLLDERATALAVRAADVLGLAGHNAFARGDMAAAVNLLERTVALSNEERLDPLIELAEALQGLGRLEEADAMMASASAAAERVGDRGAAASIALDRLDLRALVDPSFGVDEMLAGAEEALRIFEELGDELGLARAWRAVAEVHLTRCHWERSADALERALGYAEQAGGGAEVAACQVMLASAVYYGPTPVVAARHRCDEILEQAAGHPIVEGNVLCYLGGLTAMEGRFDDARALHRRGRRIFEELGHTVGVAGSTTVSGPIELLAGDPAAAERELREGFETFEEMGETGILSTLAALLAEAVLAQGRDVEAEELTRTSEENSTEEEPPRRSPGERFAPSRSHGGGTWRRPSGSPATPWRSPPRPTSSRCTRMRSSRSARCLPRPGRSRTPSAAELRPRACTRRRACSRTRQPREPAAFTARPNGVTLSIGVSTATQRARRLQRITAAVIVCTVAVGATALATARPLAGGPAALRPVPGRGSSGSQGRGLRGRRSRARQRRRSSPRRSSRVRRRRSPSVSPGRRPTRSRRAASAPLRAPPPARPSKGTRSRCSPSGPGMARICCWLRA